VKFGKTNPNYASKDEMLNISFLRAPMDLMHAR
jgi:hypothetical protein